MVADTPLLSAALTVSIPDSSMAIGSSLIFIGILFLYWILSLFFVPSFVFLSEAHHRLGISAAEFTIPLGSKMESVGRALASGR